MNKYLRNKEDGTIYDWNERLAAHPKCEEVTEEEAYPERFIPKKQRGRKTRVKLDTPEPEVPDTTPLELAEEASRGLPE
jgi:hypothetical protein